MKFFGAGDSPVAVAEKIVGIAGGITGTTDPAQMLTRMRESAEAAQKFQLAVLAADTDLERAWLADRSDARSRDVEVRKLTGGSNTRADMLAGGAVLGMISCLVVLGFFRTDIPGEAVGIISTIAGLFGACLRDAFAFEFGSSRGSKDKDELLARISRG